jgi:hypothetical protein
MLHRHVSTLRLKVCHIRSHQRLRGFGYYLRELSPRNRHDCLRYFPICMGGQAGQVSNRRPHVVGTGVTAVHGQEGEFLNIKYPSCTRLIHGPTAHCIRIWGPIKKSEAVCRVAPQ